MDENNLYSMDGTIPLGKAIPLGLQHILAMFVSNITPIIILAGICAGAEKWILVLLHFLFRMQ